MKVLYKKIREVRINRGLSQAELGRMCKVSSNFIYLIESGKKNPSLSTLSKIADCLKVTVSFFFEDDLKTDLKSLTSKYDIQDILETLKTILSEHVKNK